MNRNELIQETREVLTKTGFFTSEENESRLICFDIVARRDNLLVIIKILTNADSFSKQNSNELMVLSNTLSGAPIIVGERTSKKRIETGIVYFRHGVPLVNFETLYDFFVEGVPPLICSAPGGFYVNIDGITLRNARENQHISLGTLAEIAGVTRKAIQMYENGMSTMIEVAVRLEEYLEKPLIKPLDPFVVELKPEQVQFKFDHTSDIEHEIFQQLQDLGYKVVPTTHCPFDAITKDRKIIIITGVNKKDKNAVKKARSLSNISKITEQYSVMFFEQQLRKANLEGTPIIHTGELKNIADSDDILTLISERSS